MENARTQAEQALLAAQMYYYQDLPMKLIAAELEVSASTVSRLLNWARMNGLVEVRINDLHGRAGSVEEQIKLRYNVLAVTVVPVPETSGQLVWQDRVARVAASYLNQVMKSKMRLGLAWGKMVNQMAGYLIPKPTVNAQVVQLNGGDQLPESGQVSAVELTARVAANYEASAHLLYVPAWFDSAETKKALWQESSIDKILQLQKTIDIALFGIDMVSSEEGSIAGVFIRPNSTPDQIEQNSRSSGPDLSVLQNASRSICVASGFETLTTLQAALENRYLTDLIIDEPLARRLLG